MHYVLARITVKPEAADSARQLLTTLVAQSRKEEGCVSYELYQQAATPHVFQTVEQWKDEAAAKAHMGTPHVGAAIAAAGPLFAAAPEILAYNKLA
jgi:quinol monooxygenase YgiN